MDKPKLIVVGGPNGAGKSTLSYKYAAELNAEYVGADDIAHRLCPEDPYSVRIASSRAFIERIKFVISEGTSLVVETTLAGKTFEQFIKLASDSGYETTIVFIFLDSDDLCVKRVAQRVKNGGHDVPETDIRRRFKRTLANFWDLYRNLVDNWIVAYNGGEYLQDVAIGSQRTIAIRDEQLFQLFLNRGGLVEDE